MTDGRFFWAPLALHRSCGSPSRKQAVLWPGWKRATVRVDVPARRLDVLVSEDVLADRCPLVTPSGEVRDRRPGQICAPRRFGRNRGGYRLRLPR